MKVFLIELTGIDDKDQTFVNQEVWDWITSNNMGKLPNADERCWEDQLVPQFIKDNWHKEYSEPYQPIEITSGTWQNDRAFYAISPDGLDYDKIDWQDLRNSLKLQGFDLDKEIYEGQIY